MEDTTTPSQELALRAKRLMERFPKELAKAIHVTDKIGYTITASDIPKKRKVREDGNPLLLPRTKPLHHGAVTLSRPSKKHKTALKGLDLEYVVDVKAAVWDLMSEDGKNGELFNRLLSIEVVEKLDGSLKYGMFKAGEGYHELAVTTFGQWWDDIIDPRDVPLKSPPTVEELTAERMANRPDAMVVTSAGEK